MARPRELPIVDLLVDLPRGGSGMGMEQARRLTKDSSAADFENDPAEYLFRDAGERMKSAMSIDELVDKMDEVGITTAQIEVDPRRVEESHAIFERFPGCFFGTVGIDPNLGMKSLLSMKRAVESHPDIKSVSAAPRLYAPQVPIDAALMYPFYAACCELDVPINVLAGVPGPRVPFVCQRVDRIDRVCYDFPDLKFVMRHGCEPWQALAVKLMLKWPESVLLDNGVRSEALSQGDRRLREHARCRQGDARRILPRPVVGASAGRTRRRRLSRQGLGAVSVRQRSTRVRPRGPECRTRRGAGIADSGDRTREYPALSVTQTPSRAAPPANGASLVSGKRPLVPTSRRWPNAWNASHREVSIVPVHSAFQRLVP